MLPKHVMNILELQGYSSCDALGEIQDSDKTLIENDLRVLAPIKKDCMGAEELKSLYGHFAVSPESFAFLNGERKAILKIAEVVKKSGIHHFLPRPSVKSAQHLNQTDYGDKNQLAMELIGRIRGYYKAR